MGLYRVAVDHYGIEKQLKKTVEELTELSLAIQHYNDRSSIPMLYDNVCEEIADVEIMLKQLRVIFSEERINEWRDKKEARLADLVGYDKGNLPCANSCGECKCK